MSDTAKARPAGDRNLLFGVLALQLDFLGREALIEGLNAWVLDKGKPLGDILVQRGALRRDAQAVLEALVEKHLEMHQGDTDKSLASLRTQTPLRLDLGQITDPEVQASLSGADQESPPTVPPAPGDESPAVGKPTSAGQRFRILRPHARGGLGEVFLAQDEELQREVALKEIQGRWADHAPSRARFLLEAAITGGLEHPGIVPVYGLGAYPDGRPYYAMRFIKGDSLKTALRRFHDADKNNRSPGQRTLELRQLLGRFVAVCNAVAYAHSRGVLHRDLKPDNVMLGPYGETLVVDWGLAKTVGRPEGAHDLAEQTLRPESASDSAPTQAGAVLGTPPYMSPEQAAGRLDQLGPASDVYSLGATLYVLLTGKAPFEGNNVGTILQRVQRGVFPAPRQVQANVPAALEAVCLKAMALQPEERYASARALAEEIERWLADEPVSAYREPWMVRAGRWLRRHRTVVAASAAALLVALVSLAAAAALLTSANTELANANLAEQHARELAVAREADATRQARQALYHKGLAEVARNEAEKQKTQAQEEAARLAVVTGLAADNAWEAGHVEEARDFLDVIPLKFRAWEWRYRQGHFQGSYMTLYGHIDSVNSVAFSPDGKRLASASAAQTVKVWEASSGRELLTLRGHTDSVESVAFSPDGQRLASVSKDQTVKVWEASSGRELLTLRGHTNWVQSVAFSPDGQRLASASYKTVKMWEASSGRELLILRGHTDWVSSVAFSPDGQRLASASFDNRLSGKPGFP